MDMLDHNVSSNQSIHHCIFYKNADELWSLCTPLIQAALKDKWHWRYIVDEHKREDVLSALETWLGTTLSPDLITNGDSLHLLDTPISIDKIMSQLLQQVTQAVNNGAKGLLIFVEMSWVLRTSSGAAYLGEYEAALHELIDQHPIQAICLYNRRLLPEALMVGGLRTHPTIWATDGLHQNPHFLPPPIFLSGDRQAQLQCWLGAISPTLADQSEMLPNNKVDTTTQPTTTIPPRHLPKATIYSLESPTPLTATTDTGQRWKIHCLGRLRVYRQDSTEVTWNVVSGATLKTKTLFAYLLHRGQEGATIEEIATLLWPESNNMEASLNRLYHTVHCLRMALSPELKSSRHSPFVLQHDQRYFLALPKGTWVDIPIFEQLCYRGERLNRDQDDEQALICGIAAEKLYSGDLLEDIPLEYAANIEHDWCWSRRYWLREMYLKLLSDIASSYRKSGNTQHALAYCEQALRLDPYSELAHTEMMRNFHAAGRRDALTRQYRLYCQAVERFDGGGPSPMVEEIYQSLMTTL
ncbi:MAG: MEDS domain-containing protein [Chloroflexota bacterium]